MRPIRMRCAAHNVEGKQRPLPVKNTMYATEGTGHRRRLTLTRVKSHPLDNGPRREGRQVSGKRDNSVTPSDRSSGCVIF